jgi:hypothetical protein
LIKPDMSTLAVQRPSTARPLRRLIFPSIAGAIVVATFIAYVGLSAPFDSDWRAHDVQAYWGAAERLRAGLPLYAPVESPYQYSPWFAFLWIPLTYLPRDLVTWTWLLILAASVVWLALPLLRSYAGLLLAMLVIPQVMEYAWIGNVDALMLLALTLLNRRIGPVVVGLAASLKITPIAFVLVYLVRREWVKAGVSCLVAAIFSAPILLFDLSAVNVGTGMTPYSLWGAGPIVGAVTTTALVLGCAYFVWRDRSLASVASAVVAMLGNPRVNLYNIGYLLVPAHTARLRADSPNGKLPLGPTPRAAN